MNKVSITHREILAYIFYVSNYENMNRICKKSTTSSSNNIYKQYQTEKGEKSGNGEEKVEVPVINKKYMISVEYVAAVSVLVFKVNGKQQDYIFKRGGQVADSDSLLRGASHWNRLPRPQCSTYAVSVTLVGN